MKEIARIAEGYFNYLAGRYPVMCLADEFYFFPRVKQAAEFLNNLDSLDEQKIKQSLKDISGLKSALEKISPQDISFEEQIDRRLLIQSMSTFLREFGQIKIWQQDPTLYLKIILLGIDQIVNRFSFLKHDFTDNLQARSGQIPRLLNEAKCNLNKIPLIYLEVAVEMIEAAIDYFKAQEFPLENRYSLIHALEDFKKFLIKRPMSKSSGKDRQLLQAILKDSFSYNRSLKEIFEIASLEYQNTLKQLSQVARLIRADRTWQEIVCGYQIEVKAVQELLVLYEQQISRIRDFCKEKDVLSIPQTQNILIRLTPQFLQPIRASASYSSPVTQDQREPAYFYVTADYAQLRRSSHTFSNVHNEYIFVTAHETYPGHHLLDSVRRRLKNPIRRQIESPLFYEGWASYAEQLIERLGYTDNPLQRLVGLKRQAWRAVRAMLDVGVRINKLKLAEVGALLRGLGYEAKIVEFMLRHYSLSPGYQLCYTIGKFEIERLANRWAAKLGLKRFHQLLLSGGQIPFDLLEKRIEAQL